MEYVSNEIVEKRLKEFKGVFNQVYKSFDLTKWELEYYLVGSANKGLVLKGPNGYDVDFHVILKKRLKRKPIKIKNRFKREFDKAFKSIGLSSCEDSTHVLTAKKKDKQGNIIYSYDIAIVYIKSGKTYILKNKKEDKGNGPYQFVAVPDSKGVYAKLEKVKRDGNWEKLKKIYKQKKEKEINILKDKKKISISLLIEAVNEI